MKTKLWFLLTLAVVGAAAIMPSVAAATDGAPGSDQADALADVTVAVVPSAVNLAVGDIALIEVIVSNPSDRAVTVTDVAVRTPSRFSLDRTLEPAAFGGIAGGDVARAHFALRALRGSEEGSVEVVFGLRTTAGQTTARRVAVGTLTVGAGKAVQEIEATFVSFPDKLTDGKHGPAGLRLSNPTPYDFGSIEVRSIRARDVRIRSSPLPVGDEDADVVATVEALSAGATVVVDLNVAVDGNVRVGKQQVGVVVSALRTVGSDKVTSTVFVPKEVEVEVFGLDLLSIFGVGSLFLLPGALALVAGFVLGRYVYPRRNDLPDTIDLKDLRFFPVAVLGGVIAYVLVFRAIGVDLTDEAGRTAVMALFGLSIGMGALAWAALALGYWYVSGRKQFAMTDDPAKVLRRLDARDARLQLPTVGDSGLQLRYLAPGPNGKVIAAPEILFSFTTENDQERSAFFSAIETDDVGSVRAAVKNGLVRLRWATPSGVRHVEGGQAVIGEPDHLLRALAAGV